MAKSIGFNDMKSDDTLIETLPETLNDELTKAANVCYG